MADNSDSSEGKTLNRLASELSLEERHNFLEKLRGQATLSFEPLYEAEDEQARAEDFEAQFTALAWYYRLYYFILGLFKGKPPVKAFEDRQIGKMGRAIQADAPGLYDYQRNHLLFNCFQPLVELKEAARFFFQALDASINRDKGAFYAFLGSLEMEEVHSRLQRETDPAVIMEKFPNTPESEMRQLALRTMEDALVSISDQQRGAMYYNARSLNCLKELSAFLFDRLILAFGIKSGGQSCPVNMVRDLLVNLNNILFSLKEPPTLSLLESLFIFLLNDRNGEGGFDMNREMKILLADAENAINTIRIFNKKIPLTRILRCATRDTGLAPRQISGGEDWFQTYREYWRRKVETGIADYIQRRKYREITSAFQFFLKGTSLRILSSVVSDNNRDGFPLPEAFNLAFLRTFHTAVFLPDLNPPLRTILMDGEFFKKENRTEFTGAYNDIMNIEEDVRRLDDSLALSGDFGKRYTQAKQDLSALPVKRRKIQVVLDEASHEATEIIIRVRHSMGVINNMLHCILKKEAGGRYDGLANFDKLAGKNPEEFVQGISDAVKQIQQTLQIMKDIDSMGSLL
ncbi:MAG: DUF5312 domain-containing protein [Treponema sp.]|jgi:hypothetical protein|nr:DUF5312 domain-containing protein [Treponema sp.]